MTPGVLMFTSAICLFTFGALMLFNFYRIFTSPFDFHEDGSKEILLHMLLGSLTGLSLITLVGGFIWFLVLL